jgi:ABC-2 type transport system permease protein
MFATNLRTFRRAVWLGWQIESNWTDPWLFIIYVVAKPLAGMFILVFMYRAASAAVLGGVDPAAFHFMFVSNACYMLVGAIMFGMSWTVIADREHYEMLKYIYISPAHFKTYLVGRGLAGGLRAVMGSVITLLIGLWFLGVPIGFDSIKPGWLLYYVAVGAVMLVSLGLILSGLVLNMGRNSYFLSEGIAGSLYLFTGVLFPIKVLPLWVQPVGVLLPPTYWLEGMRRSLMGQYYEPQHPLDGVSDAELAIILGLFALLLWNLANNLFAHYERRAWQRGKIDAQTGH